MKKLEILILLSFLALFSCKTVQEDGTSNLASTGGTYDLVITQCSSPQGNGSNWGATIGWLSETILKRAEEGLKYESQGKKVGIFVSCIAGGSSGSHVSNVFMNVLKNPNIVRPRSGVPILSPSEAVRVADALMFIGMTADLSFQELAMFALLLAEEAVEGQVTGLLAKVPLLQTIAREVLGNRTPAWWTGQVVSADKVLVDWIVTNHLARTIDLNLLYSKSRQDYIMNYDRKELIKQKRYPQYDRIPRKVQSSGEVEMENLKARSKEINLVADNYIREKFKRFGFRQRYGQGVYENINPVLKLTAEQRLDQGVCTATVGSVYNRLADINLRVPPPYSKLAVAVFCDRSTLEVIFSTPEFKQDTEDEAFLKKYVYGAARTSRGSIAVSIREPQLMKETVGAFKSNPIETDLIYDPLNQGSVKLVDADEKALAIIGGFTDRRISAWPISYYYLHTLKKIQAQTKEIKGYMEIFGKPDNRHKDKFDTKSIRTIFSKDETDGQKNVDHWFDFQDRYCELFEPRFAKYNVIVQTTAFNWDIARLPAAHAGNSSIILNKGINAVRLQTEPNTASFVFDPTIDEGFIPKTRNIPCKPS